ncbi:ATP-binding protein [Streptosporangium sp. NPDC000095]|uniref:ATP-binding protein n=1 Tax=Streptosporangium sp. NPDC000095 TaxID=3366184 RepID=UPI003684BF87
MAPSTRLHDYRVLVKTLRPGSAAHRARAVVRQVLQDAGFDGEELSDAESAVAELAANAEEHGWQPFELRVVFVDGEPSWCEVIDADRDLDGILAILDRLNACSEEPDLGLLAERGRGLLLVHALSKGRCRAYVTRICATGAPGKAVGFALPTKTGPRPSSPVPDDGPSPKAGAHLPTQPWAPAFPDHHLPS